MQTSATASVLRPDGPGVNGGATRAGRSGAGDSWFNIGRKISGWCRQFAVLVPFPTVVENANLSGTTALVELELRHHVNMNDPARLRAAGQHQGRDLRQDTAALSGAVGIGFSEAVAWRCVRGLTGYAPRDASFPA